MTNEHDRGHLEIRGVVTEPKILLAFFNARDIDIHPVATAMFLKKSRHAYTPPWLTREIVQNFVDHNGTHPGTLNGVRFTREDLPEETARFRVEGDWPFTNLTGVISLDSDKPEGRKTAGGNGLALKQTAIMFLRDFEVSKFEIQGEGWTANYRFVKASEVNAELESAGQSTRLEKDWLVAELQKTTNSGRNSYIIETKNPELIKALEQLPTLGVSEENPYLQNMDYSNQYGAIKWLPKGERGRLFINGQVMGYEEKGKPSQSFWDGPESVTVRLDNLDYKMTMDRPPIGNFDLSIYMLDLTIRGMSNPDRLEQLKRSEYLWAGHINKEVMGFEKEGGLVVVKAIVDSSRFNTEITEELSKYFAGKKYIAYDGPLSEEQNKKLQEQGYTLCPSYFERVGMRTASSIFKPEKKAPTDEEQRKELVVELEKVQTVIEEATVKAETIKQAIEVLDKKKEEKKKPATTVKAPTHAKKAAQVRRGFPWKPAIGAATLVFAAGFVINTLGQGNNQTGSTETPRPSAAAGSLPPRNTSEAPKPSATAGSLPPRNTNEGQTQAPKAVTQNSPEPKRAGKSETEKYLEWRNSSDFYGQLGDSARYTQGRKLDELIHEQYQDLVKFSGTGARVEPPKTNEEVKKQAETIVTANRPPEDVVRNFEVVANPTKNQLAQLGLLRLYTQVTTGLAIPNDLFIYKGEGASGINIGKSAIGMHENSLRVRFIETLRIFIHEVAHNYGESNGHDDRFHDAEVSTLMTIIDKTTQIANKLEKGQALTAEEKVILDIQKQWDTLRTS